MVDCNSCTEFMHSQVCQSIANEIQKNNKLFDINRKSFRLNQMQLNELTNNQANWSFRENETSNNNEGKKSFLKMSNNVNFARKLWCHRKQHPA